MEDPFREELVRQLIGQAAESRGLDYKGPMAWAGSKAERAELIRDLMCFSNTPDGGYILVGVDEGAAGWVLTGLTPDQAETFDPTKIGDPREQLLLGSSGVLSPPSDARGKALRVDRRARVR
jgi:schlafen family protein